MWGKIRKYFFKNSDRLDCRACHTPLSTAGGKGVPFVGCGFCDDCAIKLMESFNND